MGFLPQNAEGESREILSSMQYCKIIRYDKGKQRNTHLQENTQRKQ